MNGYSIRDIYRIIKSKGIEVNEGKIRNTINKYKYKPIYTKDIGYNNPVYYYDGDTVRKIIQERIRIYNQKQSKIKEEKETYTLTTTEVATRLNELGLVTMQGERITPNTIVHLINNKYPNMKRVGGGKGNPILFSESNFNKIKNHYEKQTQKLNRLTGYKDTIEKQDTVNQVEFKNLKDKHNSLVDYAKYVNERLEDLLVLISKNTTDINELQKERDEKNWYKNQYQNLLRDYDFLLKRTTEKKSIFKRIFGG